MANISIFSGIEPDAEDTLVPIDEPTFHINEQGIVNGLMVNTLKFEGEGYIADHYIYRIELEVTGNTKVDGPNADRMHIIKVGNKYIISGIGSFMLKSNKHIDVISGSGDYERVGDDYVVDAVTSKGDTFNVVIDAYTSKYSFDNNEYICVVRDNGDKINILIKQRITLYDYITFTNFNVYGSLKLIGIDYEHSGSKVLHLSEGINIDLTDEPKLIGDKIKAVTFNKDKNEFKFLEDFTYTLKTNIDNKRVCWSAGMLRIYDGNWPIDIVMPDPKSMTAEQIAQLVAENASKLAPIRNGISSITAEINDARDAALSQIEDAELNKIISKLYDAYKMIVLGNYSKVFCIEDAYMTAFQPVEQRFLFWKWNVNIPVGIPYNKFNSYVYTEISNKGQFLGEPPFTTSMLRYINGILYDYIFLSIDYKNWYEPLKLILQNNLNGQLPGIVTMDATYNIQETSFDIPVNHDKPIHKSVGIVQLKVEYGPVKDLDVAYEISYMPLFKFIASITIKDYLGIGSVNIGNIRLMFDVDTGVITYDNYTSTHVSYPITDKDGNTRYEEWYRVEREVRTIALNYTKEPDIVNITISTTYIDTQDMIKDYEHENAWLTDDIAGKVYGADIHVEYTCTHTGNSPYEVKFTPKYKNHVVSADTYNNNKILLQSVLSDRMGVNYKINCISLLKNKWEIEEAEYDVWPLNRYVDYSFVASEFKYIASSNVYEVKFGENALGLQREVFGRFVHNKYFNTIDMITVPKTGFKTLFGLTTTTIGVAGIKDYNEDNPYTQDITFSLNGTNHTLRLYHLCKDNHDLDRTLQLIDTSGNIIKENKAYVDDQLYLLYVFKYGEYPRLVFELGDNIYKYVSYDMYNLTRGSGISKCELLTIKDDVITVQLDDKYGTLTLDTKSNKGSTTNNYITDYTYEKYYLIKDNTFEAIINKYGFIYKGKDVKYIEADNNTIKFKYNDKDYVATIDTNARMKSRIIASDILKYRNEVPIDIPDVDECYTINELINVVTEDDIQDDIRYDKDDNMHRYYVLSKYEILEITDAFVRYFNKDTGERNFWTIQDYFGDKPVACGVASNIPYVYALYVDEQTITLKYKRYNDNKWATKAFTVGTELYTVAPVSAIQIVAQSVISAVGEQGNLWVGLKLTRGMHQWTICSSGTVVNGFGSVGINGLITGNWLPTKYCSSRGFIGKPTELTAVSDINSLNKCYIVDGTIMFIDKEIKGYVYAIGIDGSLYTQDDMSSTWKYVSVKEEISFDRLMSFMADIPVGQILKTVIEGILNLPGAVIKGVFSAIPIIGMIFKAIHIPKAELPSDVFKALDIPLNPGIMPVYGVNAMAGNWFMCNTWLTAPRDGDQIYNPVIEAKASVKEAMSEMLDLLKTLAGAVFSAIKNKNKTAEEVEELLTTQISGAEKGYKSRFTPSQADRVNYLIGQDAPGSNSEDSIAALMHVVGVDPSVQGSIRKAIMDCTGNPNNQNKTWQSAIINMTEPDKPAVPARFMSELINTMPTQSVGSGHTNSALNKLPAKFAKLASAAVVEAEARSEIHIYDDIFHCCSDKQSVYSVPGCYSIQLYRANRRQQFYQQYVYWTAVGWALNVPALASGLCMEILGTGIQMPDLGPKVIERNYGTDNTYSDIDVDDQRWLGGQHVYLAGPSEKYNKASIITPKFDINISSDNIAMEPEELRDSSLSKKYTHKWVENKENVTIGGNMGIIVGNKSGFGKDGIYATGQPTFTSPMLYDGLIDNEFELYCTFSGDDIMHLSIKDTKIIDGTYTNIIKEDGNMYIASSYCVLEVKPGFIVDDIIPYNTVQGLRLNKTGYNWIQGIQLIHAFDGYGSRINTWIGKSGGDTEHINMLTQYLPNEYPIVLHSMFPPSIIFGAFETLPDINYKHPVNVVSNDVTLMRKNTFVDTKALRISIPLIYHRTNEYPAGIQTIAGYKLFVVDGRTSLTTDVRSGFIKGLAKAKDAMIYSSLYRAFDEYISATTQRYGVLAYTDQAMKIGLKVIGADTSQMLLYSRPTRQIYKFTSDGATSKVLTAYRVKDIFGSKYEFLKEELIADVELINPKYNNAQLRISNGSFVAMVPKAHFKPIDKFGGSAGFVIQGRDIAQCVFNIFDYNMYTLNIEHNRDKWKRVSEEDFYSERVYKQGIYGYYWEPFRLLTSFLGSGDENDNQYEWVITFAFTEYMERIVKDRYVTVMLMAETALPNGFKKSNITKLRLRDDMFRRSPGHIGYYSFKFNGRNGAGNAERLYLWSDGLIAVRKIVLNVIPVTSDRTSPMYTQPDFVPVEEF